MAKVRPFKAVRPAEHIAEKVIAPPYDVMNREEAEEMVKEKPHSFLHISRSEVDMPEQPDPYDESVYRKAGENLKKFIDEGTMIREENPVFMIYGQTMDGRTQTGIVGCASIDDYENDVIKKHELTRVEKELDRINHFKGANAHTEPVFLTYRKSGKVELLKKGWMDKHEPQYELESEDGVKHKVWVVDDAEVNRAFQDAFKDIPELYIADGHHRSASAYKVGANMRKEHQGYTGDEEFNFFMAVIYPADELYVYEYNRVVKDLNGNTPEEFLEKINKAGFKSKEWTGSDVHPERKGEFAMYLKGKWYRLEVSPDIVPDDAREGLDVSVLQNSLLDPILGIKDPRTDGRIDFVGGIRGSKELEKRVDDDMEVAFLLYPVTMEDLFAVSDRGQTMPPKSTWFEPKPASGLFLHELS